MKSYLLTGLLCIVVSGCGRMDTHDPVSAPDVQPPPALVLSMWDQIGSPDDLAALPRYLRFDFRLSFNGNEFIYSENLWDRHTDRYRTRFRTGYLEGSHDAVVDMKSGNVAVFRDGVPIDDEDLSGEASYRAHNDTYWLVAPFKLTDPGTQLDPMPGTDGAFHLTFGDGVGETPRDQFWIYLDPETGMWDHWAYFLQSQDGEPSLDQANVWRWEDWESFGPVKLARSRSMMASPQFPQFSSGRIEFPVLRFLDSVDVAVFTDPDVALP